MSLFYFIFDKMMFWVLIGLLILEAYNLIVHKGIPNIRTAPAIRNKMIELLKEDMAKRKLATYTIVDLGSGNGKLSRAIAKAIPEARVIGVEITPHSVRWSNYRKRIEKIPNLEYRRMNCLDYDLSEPDAVVMYLLPHLTHKLGPKLLKEAKPDIVVICNNFPLGGCEWKPDESLKVKTLYVNQRDVYVYHKPS